MKPLYFHMKVKYKIIYALNRIFWGVKLSDKKK
jgi:hypothetical protein